MNVIVAGIFTYLTMVFSFYYIDKDAQAIQIAAISGSVCFNQYIMPTIPISYGATKVTKLNVVGNQLYHDNQPLQSFPLDVSMTQFVSWLESLESKHLVLVGHNVKSFDCKYLVRDISSFNLSDRCSNIVSGIVDTLPLFKEVFPGQSSYAQESLVNNILGLRYDAHNAIHDVSSLQLLYNAAHPELSVLTKYSFTLPWLHDYYNYQNMTNQHYQTLKVLVDNKVLSKGMAKQIAGSGLSFHHLRLASQRDNEDGIKNLLTETFNGKPRVTKSKRIINNLAVYFLNKGN